MCRWMAWLGQPVLIEELLFNSPHGIVDQSLHSRMGAETTNGDGFGMGWYGSGGQPAVYHSVAPAWSDSNLRELAAHVESCNACRSEIDAMRRVSALLSLSSAPPADLFERITLWARSGPEQARVDRVDVAAADGEFTAFDKLATV